MRVYCITRVYSHQARTVYLPAKISVLGQAPLASTVTLGLASPGLVGEAPHRYTT